MSNVSLRGQGLLEQLNSDYTYLGIIGKLRRGISVSIVAELCGLKEKDLISKLNDKGFDSKGEPLYNNVVYLGNEDYTPITPEITKLLLDGLKHGYDTDYLIETYHLERKAASGVLLDLRRKMKEDATKLYPLSSIKGTQGKYRTMLTVYKRDLD